MKTKPTQTRKKSAPRSFRSNAPSLAAVAADLISSRSVSIHDIATEAMKRGAEPLVWELFIIADRDLRGYLTAAESILGLFRVKPVLRTVEEIAAFSMKERDGCFDSWPDGQEKGDAIYDKIEWIPEGATPRR